MNRRLCHWRWLNWIVSLSLDLRLQTLLWPLLPGRYGSAAAAIFGGSGRLRSHLCMGCRLTVLLLFESPFLFLFFSRSHAGKCVSWVHLHVQHTHLLAWICTCASRVSAAEQTRGGKSNAVAVESYPWCRNHGNKAWKACDLIVISAAIQNSNP